MDDLPIHPGTYALIIRLSDTIPLVVGKLGRLVFSSGMYVYLGSAHGPGGLCARLGRHLQGGGRTHWHIDYLLEAGEVQAYGIIESKLTNPTQIPIECQWAQYLTNRDSAKIPVPGFGASDCKSGCQSHLIQFPVMDISDYLSGFIELACSAGWLDAGVYMYKDLLSGHALFL